MSREKRKIGNQYYYRSNGVDGRCLKRYRGCSDEAERAAQRDQRRRHEEQESYEWWREQIALIEKAEVPLLDQLNASKLLLSSVMVLSGYHAYRGHSWRKRKGIKRDNSKRPDGLGDASRDPLPG